MGAVGDVGCGTPSIHRLVRMKSSHGTAVAEAPFDTAKPVMFWTATKARRSICSLRSKRSGTVPLPNAGTTTALDVFDPEYAVKSHRTPVPFAFGTGTSVRGTAKPASCGRSSIHSLSSTQSNTRAFGPGLRTVPLTQARAMPFFGSV